ncbi:hypothetical protein ACFOOK_05525 [Micromonospora krabiensis]|uniref:Clumping factor A n=1 Tax=Micromonospora krabiensis TaxID=307121 RepID=A0A1C3ND86_9ACTN|nr:hypothetical protein [Micromonospora krabiensis]SBV30546.1 hypothetical protein GA0070620_6144 [Micromonospora krabiensis]
MIVASLLLILVAVVLLVLGLAGGSSLMLIISIAASLLAAVALVVGARQAAADRAAAGRPERRGPEVIRPPTDAAGAGVAYGPPLAEPEIPVQHVPPTYGTGDPGWRQPPEAPADDEPSPYAAPVDETAGPYDDEPDAQPVTLAEAALVARLPDEVRVVDGRPRYHLADCAHLVGRVHEPVPVAEAVELGFTPCAHCAPATALLADSRPG